MALARTRISQTSAFPGRPPSGPAPPTPSPPGRPAPGHLGEAQVVTGHHPADEAARPPRHTSVVRGSPGVTRSDSRQPRASKRWHLAVGAEQAAGADRHHRVVDPPGVPDGSNVPATTVSPVSAAASCSALTNGPSSGSATRPGRSWARRRRTCAASGSTTSSAPPTPPRRDPAPRAGAGWPACRRTTAANLDHGDLHPGCHGYPPAARCRTRWDDPPGNATASPWRHATLGRPRPAPRADRRRRGRPPRLGDRSRVGVHLPRTGVTAVGDGTGVGRPPLLGGGGRGLGGGRAGPRESLLLEAPMEELTHTANAQLATFVLSLVVLDAVERLGLSPAACAGHSLGEYTALVARAAPSPSTTASTWWSPGARPWPAPARTRPGPWPPCSGITDDDAEAACQRAEGDVWVANYNAPGQVVVAGTAEAVATVAVHRQGARGPQGHAHPGLGRLPHAPHGRRPGRPCARRWATPPSWRPRCRWWPTSTPGSTTTRREWPGLLSAQLCSPVRWRQTLETLAGLGATSLVELGPGGRADRPGPPGRARAARHVGRRARRPRRPDGRGGGARVVAQPSPPPTRASTSTCPSGSW